jgi:hypothetical protein
MFNESEIWKLDNGETPVIMHSGEGLLFLRHLLRASSQFYLKGEVGHVQLLFCKEKTAKVSSDVEGSNA